jgi:hypothetical protein
MILFLDFDGVLHGYGETRFKHLPVLETVLRENPRVEIVFSTSWRENYDLNRLKGFFSEDIQPQLIGATPVLDVNKEPPYIDFVRHKEILLWLEKQNMPDRKWVILDDDDRQFPPDCPELIRCQPEYGLGEAVVIEELKRRLR